MAIIEDAIERAFQRVNKHSTRQCQQRVVTLIINAIRSVRTQKIPCVLFGGRSLYISAAAHGDKHRRENYLMCPNEAVLAFPMIVITAACDIVAHINVIIGCPC